MFFEKILRKESNKPTKAEINRLSEHYRNMILSHKEVELIPQEDYSNLLDVAKYAVFGRSTAIQAAFYLGYLAGKDALKPEKTETEGKQNG